MPKMEWAQFQRDHHRPHLLVVSVVARKASNPPTEAPDLERLAVRLEPPGTTPSGWKALLFLLRLKMMVMPNGLHRCSGPSRLPGNRNGPRRPGRGWMAPLSEEFADILRGARLTAKRRKFLSCLASIGPPYSCDASWRREPRAGGRRIRIRPARSRRTSSLPAVIGYHCLPPRRVGTLRQFISRDIA